MNKRAEGREFTYKSFPSGQTRARDHVLCVMLVLRKYWKFYQNNIKLARIFYMYDVT